MIHLTEAFRRQRLSALADKVGGKAALGRMLGYRDGAFVGQMISGDRPITEKTINAIHEKPEFSGWFSQVDPLPAPPNTTSERLHRYPLISSVQAGDWTEVHDPFHAGDADEWPVTTHKASHRAFWLTIEGDSMEPDFPAGGMILVDPKAGAVVGDYVVAKETTEHRATFKKLTQDGDRHYLTPINRQYQAMPIDCNTIRIIGRVVLHQPKARKL